MAWWAELWPAGHLLLTSALDHSLWTQNPSRSSKVSKDSYCNLISNKNFSEILPSNVLGPGPGEVGQGSLKVHHLWQHSQKIRNPQAKNFFWVQTRRLATSFVPELRTHKATCHLVVLAQNPQKRLDAKMLSLVLWLQIWGHFNCSYFTDGASRSC